MQNREDATHANNLCSSTRHHPGRSTEYISPGCKLAGRDLAIDPMSEAVRRWMEIFFSFDFGLPRIFHHDEEDKNNKASLGVTIPFGLGRIVFLALLGLLLREWYTPTVTFIQGGFNRLRAGPLSPAAA